MPELPLTDKPLTYFPPVEQYTELQFSEKIADYLNTTISAGISKFRGKPYDQIINEILGAAFRFERKPETATPGTGEAYGFLRLYRDLIGGFADEYALSLKKGKRKDKESLEITAKQAVFNQLLARDLYLAINGGPELQALAEFFVRTARQLTNTALGHEADKLLSGARAQAGLMDLLQKNGFDILIPTINDIDDIKETRTWDVFGGVDFVAVSPDKQTILMFDAKGRGALSRESAEVWTPTVTRLQIGDGRRLRAQDEILESVRKISGLPNDVQSVYLQVFLPSKFHQLDPLGRIEQAGGTADAVLDLLKQLWQNR